MCVRLESIRVSTESGRLVAAVSTSVHRGVRRAPPPNEGVLAWSYPAEPVPLPRLGSSTRFLGPHSWAAGVVNVPVVHVLRRASVGSAAHSLVVDGGGSALSQPAPSDQDPVSGNQGCLGP